MPKGFLHRNRWPRRYGALFALLGLLILIEVVAVFVVLASQRYAAEQALSNYSQELLTSVADETRENALAYLGQAQDTVALASRVFEAGLISIDDPARQDSFFLEQLRVVPQIDGIFYGDQEGNFVFSKRDHSTGHGGFVTKTIRAGADDARRVVFVERASDLSVSGRRVDPNDTYDPRKRPWYKGALGSDSEIWTEPYIFFTSRRPGLTVAAAVRDSQGNALGVVGADIELSVLSHFLETQRIGASGVAFIIDRSGRVLAYPRDVELAQPDGDDRLRLKRLDDLDAVTAGAAAQLARRYQHLGDLRETYYDRFETDGKWFLSMFVPLLELAQNRWIMGMYAPEEELALRIREGQRESVLLGVAVSLLVGTAAILIGLVMLRPIQNLQRQASEDSLTGLLNRRGFDEIAATRFRNAVRQQGVASALMADIDNFKSINDEHGHAIGDEVLVAVADRIRGALSKDDLLSRYGGEEFAVVLPDATLEQAQRIAERLRRLVGGNPIKTSAGEMQVSISLGVAECGRGDSDISQLLKRADRGLLAAKRAGRDRVVAVPNE